MKAAPFYQSAERQAALRAEALSWLGTPFRENCAVKGPGGGVDCSRYIAAVNAACGIRTHVPIEVLPVEWVRDWGKHHAESRMVDFFNQPEVRARVRPIDADEPRIVGDIVALRFEQGIHHLALWLGVEILHVTTGAGVVSTSTRDPRLERHIRSTYRIFECGT